MSVGEFCILNKRLIQLMYTIVLILPPVPFPKCILVEYRESRMDIGEVEFKQVFLRRWIRQHGGQLALQNWRPKWKDPGTGIRRYLGRSIAREWSKRRRGRQWCICSLRQHWGPHPRLGKTPDRETLSTDN